MRTLDEAQHWYESTRRNLTRFGRLSRRYWADLPWDGPLARDEHLRELDPEVVRQEIETALAELDDLAVLVLFSVFEHTLRTLVQDQVRGELDGLSHPTLKHTAAEVRTGLREGSFYNNILEPLKGIGHDDLIEQVNQVRHYRNWVAHGRDVDKRPAAVTPRIAFERLQSLLTALVD